MVPFSVLATSYAPHVARVLFPIRRKTNLRFIYRRQETTDLDQDRINNKEIDLYAKLYD